MRITGVATNETRYEKCQMPMTIDEDLRFVVNLDDMNNLTKPLKKQTKFEPLKYGRDQFKTDIQKYFTAKDLRYIKDC